MFLLQQLTLPALNSSTGDFRYFDGDFADFSYWAEQARLLTSDEVSRMWVAGVGSYSSSSISINGILCEANVAPILNSISGSIDIQINNINIDGYADFESTLVQLIGNININNILINSEASFISYYVSCLSDINIPNIQTNIYGNISNPSYSYISSSNIILNNININAYTNTTIPNYISNSNIILNSINIYGYVNNINTSESSSEIEINPISFIGNARFIPIGLYNGSNSNIIINPISVNGYAIHQGIINYNPFYFIGKDHITSLIENNIKMYFDWGLLTIGAWTDVNIPTEQIYGGDYSKLKVVDDMNYSLGQVWEAPRKDFVYEQEIYYINKNQQAMNPTEVGTPYIDSFPATTDYYINYPMGQVIFEDPISTGSNVQLSYSYRNVQIRKVGDLPWWSELQFYSTRFDTSYLQQIGTGEWSIFGQHRFQLPMVVIETVRGSSVGWELGTSNRQASRKVNFHIFSESRSERNNLMDIFNFQSYSKIPFLDINKILAEDNMPIDYRGGLKNSLQYQDLVSRYKYRICYLRDSTVTNISRVHPNLYTAIVQTSIDVII